MVTLFQPRRDTHPHSDWEKPGGELTNIADMGNIFGTQGNMVDILK